VANIAIPNLPVKTISPYQYADLHMDLVLQYTTNNQLHKKPEHKDLEIDYDINAIKNSLINLLTTSPGEKILDPAFGLDLRYFLFEPFNRFNDGEFTNRIYSYLRSYEPRINIIQINSQGNQDLQSYAFNIIFTIPTLSTKMLSLNGSLNSNGYVFN